MATLGVPKPESSEIGLLAPTTCKLELSTAHGPVYRDVLDTLPRDCTAEEIPVIDLSPLYSGSLEDRVKVAEEVRAAGVNTGFFYIQNHGISGEIIANAKKQCLAFFREPIAQKEKVTINRSKYFNGYKGARLSNVSPSESFDVKESLAWRYSPELDPEPKPLDAIPEEVKPWIRGEDFVWKDTAHLFGFKEDCIAYWGACLTLARRLVRVFALSLDLPENYFDSRTTYPGADGVFNYYPQMTEEEKLNNVVGLGSHTDLQLFTLLWQDMVGGLQVLNKHGQWIKAAPIENTFVVNIGDFMMRLTNDTFVSTVHRVYNRATTERISMPFFFGLNFNCVEGVIPTCTNEANPPKYEPVSCGDWCQLRFQHEADTAQAKSAALKEAVPRAMVAAA